VVNTRLASDRAAEDTPQCAVMILNAVLVLGLEKEGRSRCDHSCQSGKKAPAPIQNSASDLRFFL
jgi:hypothetical protein